MTKLAMMTSFAIKVGKDWERSTLDVDRFEWRCFGLDGCQTERGGYATADGANRAAKRHLESKHPGSRQLADWTGDDLSDGHAS